MSHSFARSVLFLLALFTVAHGVTACAARQCSIAPTEEPLAVVPTNAPLDVALVTTSQPVELHLEVTNVPPGLRVEGARLVGTPTTAGSYDMEVDVTSPSADFCPTSFTATLTVRAIECADEDDCFTRGIASLFDGGPCAASTECTPVDGTERRCIPYLSGGLCAVVSLGCGGDLVSTSAVDVEGRSFATCAPTGAVACNAPGWCDWLP